MERQSAGGRRGLTRADGHVEPEGHVTRDRQAEGDQLKFPVTPAWGIFCSMTSGQLFPACMFTGHLSLKFTGQLLPYTVPAGHLFTVLFAKQKKSRDHVSY